MKRATGLPPAPAPASAHDAERLAPAPGLDLGTKLNIAAVAEAVPTWDAQHPDESLTHRYDYAERQAARALGWYFRKRVRKAWLSTGFRFFAVSFTALGGVMPLVGGLLGMGQLGFLERMLGGDTVRQQLYVMNVGYLFIGGAALFVALDRYAGSSTGWVRYIRAGTAIETLIVELREDWARYSAELATLESDEARAERRLAALDRLRGFCLAVRHVVEHETDEWADEFKANLSRLETDREAQFERARAEAKRAADVLRSATESAVAAERAGAINLVVRAHQALADGYSVELDGHAVREGQSGPSCGLAHVAPGLHEIAVVARVAGNPGSGSRTLRGSKVVSVSGSGLTSVEIDLG